MADGGPRNSAGECDMDKIFLSGIRVFGHHGHSEEERTVGQVLVVDLELHMDLRHPGRTDILEHTADWNDIFALTCEIVSGGSHHLLESLATDLARQILQATTADEVLVRVTKSAPPIGGVCDCTGVEILRSHSDFEQDSA